METRKQILMVMPLMKGGGAERVASLLMNEFADHGYDTEFLLICCEEKDALVLDLGDKTKLTYLRESMKEETLIQKVFYKFLRLFSSVFCKPFELFGFSVPSWLAYLSFISEYRKEIKALRKKLEKNPETIVISFLQPTIPITLLAAKGLSNRVIVSERGNPERLMKSRYGKNFISKYYRRVDCIVFQTQQAQNTYPEKISVKGKVICNPIKEGLPEAYHGERNKNITTFCRISKQKNLPLLVDAFSLVHDVFPDCRLRVIGDAINEEGEDILITVGRQIENLHLKNFVDFEPFQSGVHEMVKKDAVYVNSSDYEGISNAMLEAMAIGMPSVCTDCPIGGAAMIIENGVNGMLVPVNSSQKLAAAVIRVLDDKEFAHALSCNAERIRQELSIKNIGQQWLEIIQ